MLESFFYAEWSWIKKKQLDDGLDEFKSVQTFI